MKMLDRLEGYERIRQTMRITRPELGAALALGLLGPPAGAVSGDVIELKDGHQVVGEVVAEKATALFVDLGFDIVRIPRDQVVRRGAAGESARPASAAAGRTEDEQDPTGFFDTTDLK